jgi:hypothetical protein
MKLLYKFFKYYYTPSGTLCHLPQRGRKNPSKTRFSPPTGGSGRRPRGYMEQQEFPWGEWPKAEGGTWNSKNSPGGSGRRPRGVHGTARIPLEGVPEEPAPL